MENNHSIYLLANNIVGENSYSHEIMPGTLIRKANNDEALWLKEAVSISIGDHHPSPYEFNWQPFRQGVAPAESINNILDCKYWVVTNENNLTLSLFDLSILVEPQLELSVGASLPINGGNSFETASNYIAEKYFFDTHKHCNTLNVNSLPFDDIYKLYKQLNSLPEDFSFIVHALATLNSVEQLAGNSRLEVVGQFSVIEALITHAPRLNESLDSITHQVRSKTILLGRNFNLGEGLIKPLDYQKISDKKLWPLLYSYRSQIAHGSSPSFDSKLQCLISHEVVKKFLRYVCIELIRLGLSKPQLLADIKAC